MQAVGYVCFAACCMALASCGTFGKKAPFKPKEPSSQSADTGWPPPATSTDSTPPERVAPAGAGGLLAGRVLDSYDRAPPPTSIQVLPAQDTRDAKSPAQEVATDNQGYFTIQGLRPGQHYQLIARTRDSDPKLAGTTWATPPNPRIVIFMSQDFATPNTPAAPSPPAVPGRKPGVPASPPPKRSQPSPDAGGGTPGNPAGGGNGDPAKPSNPNASSSGGEGLGARGGATIGPPTKLNEPAPAPPAAVSPQPRTEIRTQDIVDAPAGSVRVPAITNIPAQADIGRQPPPDAAPPVSGPATQVPSCVLTGKQLHNFALYGLDGRPWEYRDHQGRIVLLVFWETACLPCRAAIPHLKNFQHRYGPNGLEVIAITYELGSLQEQIRRVQSVHDRLDINYRLLLGGATASCPVRTQFSVNSFPTLVLLDEHNRIIWRHQGLDTYKLQELETLIKQQLRIR